METTARVTSLTRKYNKPSAGKHLYVYGVQTTDPDYVPASAGQIDKLTYLVAGPSQSILVNASLDVPEGLEDHLSAGTPSTPVAKRFSELAAQWREETAFCPTALEMAMHPAYQQIIGMGKSAIPLILKELKEEPVHWFWALRAITGENPVAPADRGNVPKMAQAWLIWGARNGYEF
jgi:hypothetical protein